MTEPRIIPPPPTFPPSVGAPQPPAEPYFVVVTTETAKPAKRRITGRAVIYNGTAALVALAPVFDGYSTVTAVGLMLHHCRTGAGLGAGWSLTGACVGAAWLLDRVRRGWLARFLFITFALGAALSMPVLDGLLYLMTGVHR